MQLRCTALDPCSYEQITLQSVQYSSSHHQYEKNKQHRYLAIFLTPPNQKTLSKWGDIIVGRIRELKAHIDLSHLNLNEIDFNCKNAKTGPDTIHLLVNSRSSINFTLEDFQLVANLIITSNETIVNEASAEIKENSNSKKRVSLKNNELCKHKPALYLNLKRIPNFPYPAIRSTVEDPLFFAVFESSLNIKQTPKVLISLSKRWDIVNTKLKEMGIEIFGSVTVQLNTIYFQVKLLENLNLTIQQFDWICEILLQPSTSILEKHALEKFNLMPDSPIPLSTNTNDLSVEQHINMICNTPTERLNTDKKIREILGLFKTINANSLKGNQETDIISNSTTFDSPKLAQINRNNLFQLSKYDGESEDPFSRQPDLLNRDNLSLT